MHRVSLAAVLLALAVLTCACSSTAPQPTPSGTTSSATTVDGSGIGVGENEVAPGAGTGTIEVLQEKENLVAPGGKDDNDTVTVGVKSLALDPNGTTMTLWLVFTPSFASLEADDEVRLFDINDPQYLMPTILDRTHLKSYTMPHAIDSEGWFASSELGTGARNGNSFEAWFTFSALEDDVDTVDVIVVDSWPTFTDIPVTR